MTINHPPQELLAETRERWSLMSRYHRFEQVAAIVLKLVIAELIALAQLLIRVGSLLARGENDPLVSNPLRHGHDLANRHGIQAFDHSRRPWPAQPWCSAWTTGCCAIARIGSRTTKAAGQAASLQAIAVPWTKTPTRARPCDGRPRPGPGGPWRRGSCCVRCVRARLHAGGANREQVAWVIQDVPWLLSFCWVVTLWIRRFK